MRLSNHWSVQGASPASCPPVPSPFRSGGPRNFYSTLRATGASETFTKKETCLYREEKREVKHIPKRRRRSSVSYTTTRQRERKRCGGGRSKKKKRKKKRLRGVVWSDGEMLDRPLVASSRWPSAPFQFHKKARPFKLLISRRVCVYVWMRACVSVHDLTRPCPDFRVILFSFFCCFFFFSLGDYQLAPHTVID